MMEVCEIKGFQFAPPICGSGYWQFKLPHTNRIKAKVNIALALRV